MRKIFIVGWIIALSIFMMPSIYSVFSGQHSFNDKSSCIKCHGDIKEELDSSSYHTTLSCEDCHIKNGSGDSGIAHGNVISPRCVDCHNQVESEINNNKESHKPLIVEASLSPLMKGENEACVSCHTTKSIDFKILFADIYQFNSVRINDGWQTSGFSKNIIKDNPISVQFNGTAGLHKYSSSKCEKCHARERFQLDNSTFHTSLSCESCHQLGKNSGNGTYHVAEIPLCLDCHVYSPDIGSDAHKSFVSEGGNSGEKNIACSSCHSSFNDKITYTRPSYIEWDVGNINGAWLIENLAIGANKQVEINKNLNDGNLHNISLDGDCISCHKDINDAVIAGGHSYEQWKKGHDYKNYADMNTYCISCHRPLINGLGISMHGAIKISCIDCHSKSISIDIGRNGNMEQAPFDSNDMGGIETSMSKQPYYVQSYLCIACKNTGNPDITNGSTTHFKMFTEPNIEIYVNGTKKYP